VLPVDGAAVGFPGATQIFRIERTSQTLRKGKVTSTTVVSVYGVTSLYADEASPQRLLELVREYWAIEIKQHYRRVGGAHAAAGLIQAEAQRMMQPAFNDPIEPFVL
jgi:hypothetical protein